MASWKFCLQLFSACSDAECLEQLEVSDRAARVGAEWHPMLLRIETCLFQLPFPIFKSFGAHFNCKPRVGNLVLECDALRVSAGLAVQGNPAECGRGM